MTVRRIISIAVAIAACLACCGSAVTGSKLGATTSAIVPPGTFAFLHSSGQSLGAGDNGDPPLSTTIYGNNKQVGDTFGGYPTGTADGGYQITDASCSTCVLYPLTAAIRNPQPAACQTNGPYPCNEWSGENPIVRLSDQVTAWASAKGVRYDIIASDTSQPSQPLSTIQRGNKPYDAGLWELQQATRIVAVGIDAGASGAVVATAEFLIHGQSDFNNANYGTGLAAYASGIAVDDRAITGQTRPGTICPTCVPVIASIPANGEPLGTTSISAEQMLVLTQTSSPGTYIAACADYVFPFISSQVHHTNVGYALMGECLAKIYWRSELWQQGKGAWPQTFAPNVNALGASPAPSGWSRVGNTVTFTLNGAVGAVLADTTATSPLTQNYQPHAVGTTYGAYWAGAFGFELLSGGKDGAPVAISSSSCSGSGASAQCSITSASTWSNFTVAYALHQDGTTLLDGGFVDSGAGSNGGSGPPNRIGGNIRDSDCAPELGATISGVCPYDWLFTGWYQTVP